MAVGLVFVALHPAHLAGAGRGTLSAISITTRAVAHSRRHVDGRGQTKFVLPYILGPRTHLPLKD